MSQNELAKMLSMLSPSEARKVLEAGSLVDDPLGKGLLLKLADKHSPIFADQLGFMAEDQRDLALLRLYQFEEKGLADSKIIKRGNSSVQQFRISDLGRKTANILRG
jgi:hypothetical protein